MKRLLNAVSNTVVAALGCVSLLILMIRFARASVD